MQYITQALDLLHEIRMTNSDDAIGDLITRNRTIDFAVTMARKELEALKSAGISVEIETVERAKVTKAKRRGRKAKKENA